MTWSLAALTVSGLAWHWQKQRERAPPEPSHPHSQPHRPAAAGAAGPCCTNTATAPPGTGHLPRSLTPAPLCPVAALLGRHSLPPCSCVTSPRSKCPDCVSRDLAPSHSCALSPWKALPYQDSKNSPNTEHGADPGQTVSAILSRWARQAIVRTELDLELLLRGSSRVACFSFKRQFRAEVFYIPERTFQPLMLWFCVQFSLIYSSW